MQNVMTQPTSAETISYREGLYRAMYSAMSEHDNTVILGQGVADHKGTFGTTSGMVEEFGPDRVIETPLAEEAITGVCVGAALNGLYPINTHIRADFALLAMNQLINLAAKYKYMFGGRFEVPMLVRLVVGRSWGQGGQHSQSLQSLFAHIPGLTVIMPSNPHSIMSSYNHAVRNFRSPVISLEHRLMYDLEFDNRSGAELADSVHPFASRKERTGKDVTIVATSIMVLEAKRAADILAKHGIDCEIIDLHCPSNIDRDMIMDSVLKTGRLVIADTSWKSFGTAAEICRIVAETRPDALKRPVVTMGMQPVTCPTAKALEDLFYPSLSDLTDAVAKLVTDRDDHGVPLPDEKSMADFYKKFKGPF